MLLGERPEEIGREVRPLFDTAIKLPLPLDRQLVLSEIATVLDTVASGEPAPEVIRFAGLTLISGERALASRGSPLRCKSSSIRNRVFR